MVLFVAVNWRAGFCFLHAHLFAFAVNSKGQLYRRQGNLLSQGRTTLSFVGRVMHCLRYKLQKYYSILNYMTLVRSFLYYTTSYKKKRREYVFCSTPFYYQRASVGRWHFPRFAVMLIPPFLHVHFSILLQTRKHNQTQLASQRDDPNLFLLELEGRGTLAQTTFVSCSFRYN